MKRLTSLLLILTVLGLAGQAYSGSWNLGSEWWQDPSLTSQLNLSADQKTKLEALHQTLAAELNPLKDQLLSKRMELRVLWSQTNTDQARIAEKQHEIQATDARMQEMVTKYELDCRECLTPEQRQKKAAMTSGWGCGCKWGARGCWCRGR